MDDWQLTYRVLLGSIALISAGWQLTVRIAWLKDQQMSHIWMRKELASGVTAFLLLYGTAWGQLTHRHTPVTASTYILTLGVLASLWANTALTKAAGNEAHGPK